MMDTVRVVEVGPRDGLQNESMIVTPEQRIAFIKSLAAAGLAAIEAGSFVSPRRIPQMAGTDVVLQGLKSLPGRFPVLVPNKQGLDDALAAGAHEVAIFAAASESFSRANINCSIAESIERFRPVTETAREQNVPVRGYVSCVLGCPYEGDVPLRQVVNVATQLLDLGCYEISLGDTIGVGTPGKARAMVKAVREVAALSKIAVHFHDTYGQALANIYACIEDGVRIVDSSAGGLGGCPYAKGATGNVATEDVVYMLGGLGIDAGVDMAKLIESVELINRILKREPLSRVSRAMLAKRAAARPAPN